MEPSIIFLYIVYAISIIILISAGFIYAFLIIPLVWKLAKVKNGLKVLRQLLLSKSIIAECTILIALFSLTARFIIPDINLLRYIITFTILAFSLTLLAKAIIDRRIFKNNFSQKSQDLHEKFEEEEIRIDKNKKK